MRNDRYAITTIAAVIGSALVGCGGGASTGAAQQAATSDTTSAARAKVMAITPGAADQRAAPLLAAMTQDEKIQLVHGAGLGTSPLGGSSFIPGIPRLGIPDINTVDSASGLNIAGKNATPLPSPLALAASWDLSLATDYGTLIAKEARKLGFVEALGGGVNLAREPRGGRTFEYLGEDPVLAGLLSAQRTQATQSQAVIATIKHFAFNDQETNRYYSNSVVDDRTARETELLAFELGVIKGQPGNLMCAYNLVNGLKSCQNPALLTTTLKGEWGFDGVVQSDWVAALSDTASAANAGTDEEQPGSQDDNAPNITGQPTFFNQKLKAAVQAGAVPQSRLDDMVKRKLRKLFQIGIMDQPPAAGGTIDTAAGDSVAQSVAERSMVLLKNAKAGTDTAAVLPLNTSTIKKIVVIGGHADAGVISGGGAAAVPPRNSNAVACRTPGATVMGLFSLCANWYDSAPLAAIKAKAPSATVTFYDGSDANAAATAAAAADVAIVFGTQYSMEAVDLPSLSLPDANADPANQAYDQNALITAVAGKAKRTVVVLEAGSAVTMPWLSKVHSVLDAFYPGVKGGVAIANVLFGTVNPSGKLPLTFPAKESDLPQAAISSSDPTVSYNEKQAMGYRWYDSRSITPLFPFGFGLSYTSFTYSGLTVAKQSSGDVNVTFSLTNSGAKAGAEIAQIYATLPASAGEPPKRLVGWTKVTLQPGQQQTVTVSVPAARFAIWGGKWQIPAGSAGIVVGASSRDARLTGSVTLTATTVAHAN